MKLCLFPLKPNSKVPASPNGFYDASMDYVPLPNENAGLRTGLSSGILGVDVDPKNGGIESFDALLKEHPDFPTTYTVQTPSGGRHYYFAVEEAVPSRNNFRTGIDVKSEGGYLVSPPSVIDGKAYKVVTDVEPVPCPQWILDELKKAQSAPVVPREGFTLPEGERGELAKATLKFIVEGAPPGSWNSKLTKAARDIHEQGYSFEECVAMLEKPTGYLDKADMKVIEWAYSKAPKYEPRIVEQDEQFGEAPQAPSGATSLTARDLLTNLKAFLKDKGKIQGIQTGFEPFDLCLGGLREKEVTVVHGEAKSGKSSLLNRLILSLLNKGVSVGFASREMDPTEEVLPAITSMELGKNTWKEKFSKEVETSLDKINWLDKLYFAPGYGYLPLEELTSWAHFLKAQGVKVIILDHLHYALESPEDHKLAALLIRQVKTLAMETGIHFLVVVQANKLMPEQQLGRNSLKGGAAISQTLNSLFLIEKLKPHNYPGTDVSNIVKVTLDFARSPLAKPGSFYLQYDRVTTDLVPVEFEESLTPSQPPPMSYYEEQKYGRG
jgi:archaellum biogenesis ATPase FlaH